MNPVGLWRVTGFWMPFGRIERQLHFNMRTNGKGSIARREKKPRKYCRKWQLRVSVGKNPKTGKYQTKARNFTGTYQQAQVAMRDFIAELSGLSMVIGDGSNMGILAYIEPYTVSRKNSGKVKQSSLKKEIWNLKAFARAIGEEKPVASIKARDIEKIFEEMRVGNTPSGKPASGTYLSGIYSSLKAFFAYAYKQGDIEHNPVLDVERPSADTKPKRALKRSEIASLLPQLDPRNRFEYGIILIICCGLRRSECTDALVDNVSIDDATLEILDSKTDNGIRVIPLVAFALEATKQRIEQIGSDLAFFDKPMSKDIHLMADESGRSVTPHHFGKWWQENRERFGVNLTLHELRHSFSSLLGSSGVSPKDIQELMGHASPDTALKIYTHTNTENKARALDSVFDSVLGTNSD